jgi:hypothetical protein
MLPPMAHLGLRYTDALISALQAGPPRRAPHAWLLDLIDACNDREVRAVLEAWSKHEVRSLRVGDLLMDDRFIDDSFRLPTFVKEGSGPHADVTLDDENIRSDAIVIGRTKTGSLGRYYIIEKSGTGRFQSDIHALDLSAGTTTSGLGATLDEFLARQHQDAVAAGETTALSPYL